MSSNLPKDIQLPPGLERLNIQLPPGLERLKNIQLPSSISLPAGSLPSGIALPPNVAALLSSAGAGPQPIGGSLLGALCESLADFRSQVDGDPGKLIRAMGHNEGTIPDLARSVLSAIAGALVTLASALTTAFDSVQNFVKIADAIAALVEIAVDAVKALSEIVLHVGPQMLGPSAEPLKGIHGSIDTALKEVKDAAGYVPSPDDLTAVIKELGLLLGAKVDPSAEGPGAFGKLLEDIGVGGAAAAEGGAP